MPDEPSDNPTPPTPGPPTKKVLTPSAETRPAKEKKGKKDRPEPTTFAGKLWFNWIKPIGSVIIVVVVFRSMLFDWNDVPTGSMEPEISVGDRIAVNRLAYALQAPLTGPQIGIPFIGPQFDNPLDGIPQWQWGKPDRGDIVTFWNPVTKVRMVKRIVAEPGDTIEMRGGELIINGQRTTYQDLDAAAEGLPVQTKYEVPNPVGKRKKYDYKDVEYRKETILGETRIIQHIKERWADDVQFVELNNGDRGELSKGVIEAIDFTENKRNSAQLSAYLNNNPQPTVFAEMRDGVIYIDDQPASYNDLAEKLLQGLSDGPRAKLLAKADLSIDDSAYQYKGKTVSMDVFETRFKEQAAELIKSDKQAFNHVYQTLHILGELTMTNYGPVTLGEDEYLMIGDNRNNSHDGRRFGPVERGEITGEAFAVAFSFEDNSYTNPNFSRFFKDLE